MQRTASTIGFTYDGKPYQHTIKKSEIDTKTYDDTWLYYFDENELHFEVWGSFDDDHEPTTDYQFAVNVYEMVDGEGTQLDQIDDVDVLDIDSE